ncbi:hypothetical protein [Pseudoalteromonas sp. G4]|uniref:hypothetical protein n=1 Tax=Pseudoalteromonas sp. G4 TaxID=2992761 RepID=UPI00237E6C94|nr:hypothetical protein [Pseudoalteromonas sp. G4]MDE3271746.1 hypothetical protein [Pseudoalteromonas sp. G4]
MSDKIEEIISQLSFDIDTGNYSAAMNSLAVFKHEFAIEITQQGLTEKDYKDLLYQFNIFEQLVSKMSDNKKSLIKEIAQFKSNNLKINKYIQHK